MSKIKRIIFDFDNTLVDSTDVVLNLYKEDNNLDFVCSTDKVNWDFSPYVKSEDLKEVLKYFDDKRFYERIKLLPNAENVIKKLSKNHEVIICSKQSGLGAVLKREWINKNMPYISQTIMLDQENFDKSFVEGDCIIDDYPECLLGDRKLKIKFGKYQYNRLINVEEDIFDRLMEDVSKGSPLFPADSWNEVDRIIELYEEFIEH